MLVAPPVRLVFVNIGQAPRCDLSSAMEQGLDPSISVSHAGVLDGLTKAQIQARYGVGPGSACLISKIADGSTVALDASSIGIRLARLVEQLDRDGVDVIVLLCTGEFSDLRTDRAWLIEPDRVVCNTIRGLVGDELIGVIVPLPPQIKEAQEKWRPLAQLPVFAAASPYDPEPEPLIMAARQLQNNGARALVLDCMGYAPRHKQILRDAGVGLPVIVSGCAVAGALSAFL